MTDEERKQIVSDVLAALKQNSTTIDQMLEKENCADDDFFETNKGNKISFKTLSKGYNEEQGAVGDAVRYQFKRSDGKKLYPQTSSACVTMSDGDDSLDTRVKNITTEYNVSLFHPKQGIDGSNKYTLSSAIALVPEKYRSIGIKCSFIGEDGQSECWEYLGGLWASNNFSRKDAGKIDKTIIEYSQIYELLDKTTTQGAGSESVVFLDSIVELKTEHSYRICLSGNIISGSLYLYEDADKSGNYTKVKDLHSNEVVDLTNEKGYVRMTLRANTGESLTSYIYQLDSYNFVPKKDYNEKQEELSVLRCNKHIEYQGLVGGGDSAILQYKFYTELLKGKPYLLKSDIPISGTVYLYSDKSFSSEPATLGRIENSDKILIIPSANGWCKVTTRVSADTFNAINLYTDKSMLNAGDSLTFGSGNDDTGMIRENSWTYKLSREIGYTAINVGYPGDPIDRILARCNILPYYFSEKFTIPANGDRVSIGTYKSPYIKTFDKDATSMFGQFAKSITDYAGRSNPCFIIRNKKTIPIEIAVDTSSENLYVKRLDKGESLEINEGDIFYTASLFSKDADIVTAWIGTNSLSIIGDALVYYYKLIERFYNKSDLLIIGNHMFNDLSNAQETEKALTKAYGAKYFNLRKYLIEDALSDAGLVASPEDLQDIAAGKCPRQLLSDGTHFKQIGHDLIKEQVLLRFKLLGYID